MDRSNGGYEGYKAEKEAFVSGTAGSSIGHVLLVSLVALVSAFVPRLSRPLSMPGHYPPPYLPLGGDARRYMGLGRPPAPTTCGSRLLQPSRLLFLLLLLFSDHINISCHASRAISPVSELHAAAGGDISHPRRARPLSFRSQR